ncbi:MAG TPA: hypothetical protein PKN33_03415 [Phycisphaerae bacterium]|nr:hypothetical protein [Phycisphaerae bacterium]
MKRTRSEVRRMSVLNEIVQILGGYRNPDPAFDTKLQIQKINTHKSQAAE